MRNLSQGQGVDVIQVNAPMFTTDITRLVIPTEPIFDEPLMSLFMRSALANGFTKAKSVFAGTDGLGPSHIGLTPFVRCGHEEEIAQRLALPLSEITRRMHGPVDVKGWAAAVNWFGTVLPRNFIESAGRRVSPRAMRTSQHHRAEWMVRPLTFCPETMENLVDRCGYCGHQLSWWSTCGLWRCEKCAKSLRRLRPGKVSWEYRSELRLVSALVSPNPETRDEALGTFPAPFSQWQAGEVFAAVVELGVLASRLPQGAQSKILGGMIRGDFRSYAPENLVVGYRFISGWPRSLHDAIQSLGAGQGPLSLHGLAGPFSKYLQTKARPTRLTSLFDAEIRSALSDFDLNVERVSGKRPRWGKTSGVLTQSEAMDKYHIDALTVQRLLNGGRCVIKARKEEFCYINDAAIGKSVAIWRDHAKNAYGIAQLLGVPKHSVHTLCERNLVTLVDDLDAHLLADEPIYYIDSAQALETRMKNLPLRKGVANLTLAKALRGHFHPDTWADAIEAVLNGNLPIVAEVAPNETIAMLMIDDAVLAAWLKYLPKRPTPVGVSISNLEAGRLLRVPAVHIARAVSGKLLEAGRAAGKKAGSLEITLDDLANFYERYLIQTEGEELLGLKHSNFGRLMKRAGYQPACKIRTTTIWHRSDAMALIQSEQTAAFRHYKMTRTGGRPRKWESFEVPA